MCDGMISHGGLGTCFDDLPLGLRQLSCAGLVGLDGRLAQLLCVGQLLLQLAYVILKRSSASVSYATVCTALVNFAADT